MEILAIADGLLRYSIRMEAEEAEKEEG